MLFDNIILLNLRGPTTNLMFIVVNDFSRKLVIGSSDDECQLFADYKTRHLTIEERWTGFGFWERVVRDWGPSPSPAPFPLHGVGSIYGDGTVVQWSSKIFPWLETPAEMRGEIQRAILELKVGGSWK